MFESIPDTPPDAILGLNELFQADSNPRKVNLTLGVYVDEQGTTPVLRCVKQAERLIWESETTKTYLNIAGNPAYCRLVTELILGDDAAIDRRRVHTLQTPGGSGALRVTADLLARYAPQSQIWISQPSWANHPSIFESAGLSTRFYPYFDRQSQQLQLDSMLESLLEAKPGEFVVLHGCCHNPTGVDPDGHAWRVIARHLRDQQLVPIVDLAYQGFGQGLREDAAGVAELVDALDEMLICSSFSKTFGLYRERTGALTLMAKDTESGQKVLAATKQCIRRNYSNPPSHGAAVVATILGDAALRQQWVAELAEMTSNIRAKRTMFINAMRDAGCTLELDRLHQQLGMFALLDLSASAVDELRIKHAVYLVRDGRINLAALRPENLNYVVECLQTVLQPA